MLSLIEENWGKIVIMFSAACFVLSVHSVTGMMRDLSSSANQLAVISDNRNAAIKQVLNAASMHAVTPEMFERMESADRQYRHEMPILAAQMAEAAVNLVVELETQRFGSAVKASK
jgi:hypothetical protein